MAKGSIAKNANVTISNAAAAFESKIHTKNIESLKDVDPKLVRVTRLSFEHDWDSGLSQDVRDVISFTTTAEYTNLEAATHNPTDLPRFTKVDGRLSETYKEYFLSHTEFLIDVQRLCVKPAIAASLWMQFIEFLGDVCCCFVRNLYFKFAGGRIEAMVMTPHSWVLAGKPETPHIGIQSDERYFPAFMKLRADGRQTIAWLRKEFAAIHDRRETFYGPSRFGMRDINKIGKIVFRLPALCHLLQDKRSAENDEVALPDLAEVMRHGDSCAECGVQWVAEADGGF